MAFKQNLPLLGVALFGIGGFAAFLYLRPSDQDRLRGAAIEYAKKQGGFDNVEVFGNLAQIDLAPDEKNPQGRRLYLEFAKKDGEWVFSKDLYEEFVRTIQDPEVNRQILERLGKRIMDRFKVSVNLKEGAWKYRHQIYRDKDDMTGEINMTFDYPSTGGKGRYLESFRYKEGRWTSDGGGRLFDFAGRK